MLSAFADTGPQSRSCTEKNPNMRTIRHVHTLLAALGLWAAQVPATAVEPAAQSMLVLDASGSMWGQLQGRTKIEAAREAVANLTRSWPEGSALGLMAYGHRRKGDCTDIELLLPVAALDAAAFQSKVDALTPKGMTPISASVRMAAEQLKYSEQKATVILVSDGEETCNADPCALGAELEKLGVDFTAHVIGFDLPEGRAREQLQCLARTTGGQYFEARNASELNQALDQIADQPEVAVKTADQWIPGYALEWDAGSQIGDAEPTPAQVIEFTPGQTAQECQALCDKDDQCAGWHFEPTGSYFVEYPRCHLQGKGAPMRLRNEGEGWVAGVKAGVKLILETPDGE